MRGLSILILCVFAAQISIGRSVFVRSFRGLQDASEPHQSDKEKNEHMTNAGNVLNIINRGLDKIPIDPEKLGQSENDFVLKRATLSDAQNLLNSNTTAFQAQASADDATDAALQANIDSSRQSLTANQANLQDSRNKLSALQEKLAASRSQLDLDNASLSASQAAVANAQVNVAAALDAMNVASNKYVADQAQFAIDQAALQKGKDDLAKDQSNLVSDRNNLDSKIALLKGKEDQLLIDQNALANLQVTLLTNQGNLKAAQEQLTSDQATAKATEKKMHAEEADLVDKKAALAQEQSDYDTKEKQLQEDEANFADQKAKVAANDAAAKAAQADTELALKMEENQDHLAEENIAKALKELEATKKARAEQDERNAGLINGELEAQTAAKAAAAQVINEMKNSLTALRTQLSTDEADFNSQKIATQDRIHSDEKEVRDDTTTLNKDIQQLARDKASLIKHEAIFDAEFQKREQAVKDKHAALELRAIELSKRTNADNEKIAEEQRELELQNKQVQDMEKVISDAEAKILDADESIDQEIEDIQSNIGKMEETKAELLEDPSDIVVADFWGNLGLKEVGLDTFAVESDNVVQS